MRGELVRCVLPMTATVSFCAASARSRFNCSCGMRFRTLNVRRDHRFDRSRRRQPFVAATIAAAPPPLTLGQLPASLHNSTAIFSAPNGVPVYVLGISHVSKVALADIRALCEAVQPDIVLVELCKERTGLLVDAAAPPPSMWHAARVTLPGLPSAPRWPTAEELVAELKCYGSSPVSASDIEDDAVALLATGLFRSVWPIVKPPTAAACAPAFVVCDGGRSLQTVAPLGALEFRVEPRLLPPLQELSARAEGGLAVNAAAVAAIATDALARAQQQHEPSLACLLGVRQALLALLPEASQGAAEVVFEGVELGRVHAVLQPVPAGTRRSVTGLEGSALGGQGWGIDPFQRRAPKQQQQAVSAGGLRIELGSRQSGSSSSSSSSMLAQPQRLLPWSAEQLAAAEASASSSNKSDTDGNALATLLTQTYARFQAAAGKTVGISPGAAWRTALQAAVANGASQVLLGDRPSGTTAARLAAGIWDGSRLQLLSSIPAALASSIIVGQALQPGPAAAAAAAAAALLPLVAGAWPVAAPLLEIAAFSRKSAAEIEELVRVKEPLSQGVGSGPYKLWGEDALLDWPGAMGPVISDRDAYMARACAAAAAGGPPAGLTPAYVLTTTADGTPVLQYAQPESSNPTACPPGTGAGVFVPAKAPRAVVAVVGTAHVRGMAAAWHEACQTPDLQPFL